VSQVVQEELKLAKFLDCGLIWMPCEAFEALIRPRDDALRRASECQDIGMAIFATTMKQSLHTPKEYLRLHLFLTSYFLFRP